MNADPFLYPVTQSSDVHYVLKLVFIKIFYISKVYTYIFDNKWPIIVNLEKLETFSHEMGFVY